VTFDGLALIATVEMLAIGLGSAALALLLPARQMRAKAALLLLGTAVGQYLTADASSLTSLAIIRGITGLLEGGLVAVAVELIARSATPGKHGGWFVIVQTLAQCSLAAILATLVVPGFGSAGGFQLLAATSLLPLLVVPSMLDDYGNLAKPVLSTSTAGASRARPVIALLVIFSLYLFIGAIWAFLEPIGGQWGIDAGTVGIIVSLSLLVQVLGAFSATMLEPHLRYPLVIGGGAVLAVLISLGFASGPSITLFWALSLATGFLWLFVVPWQIGMAVAADPSRKAALLVPAAQLFGAAIGPAGASAFIVAGDFRPVTWFAAGCALASLALLITLVILSRSGKEH